MREKRPKPFASEALLCQSFAAAAAEQGWTPYPETSGWDLLLVKAGVQIGIEAKLRPTLHLLAQAVDHCGLNAWAGHLRGPQYVGLLVPERDGDLRVIALALGFSVIYPDIRRAWREDEKDRITWPKLDKEIRTWTPLHFEEPAWTPPIVPTVAAGVPSPIILTEWKIRALRLIARLAVRGWVTAKDLRDFGMSCSRWYHHWLIPGEQKGRWIRRREIPGPEHQHPDIYAQLLVEERERQKEGDGAASQPAIF
jgi:hypothetical protein